MIFMGRTPNMIRSPVFPYSLLPQRLRRDSVRVRRRTSQIERLRTVVVLRVREQVGVEIDIRIRRSLTDLDEVRTAAITATLDNEAILVVRTIRPCDLDTIRRAVIDPQIAWSCRRRRR